MGFWVAMMRNGRSIDRACHPRSRSVRPLPQERGLGPGGPGSPVGEDQLGEQRARTEFELGRPGLKMVAPVMSVGRRSSALNAFKGAPDALGESPGKHGLRHARDVLPSDVLSSPQTRPTKASVRPIPLADNDPLPCGQEAVRQGSNPLRPVPLLRPVQAGCPRRQWQAGMAGLEVHRSPVLPGFRTEVRRGGGVD